MLSYCTAKLHSALPPSIHTEHIRIWTYINTPIQTCTHKQACVHIHIHNSTPIQNHTQAAYPLPHPFTNQYCPFTSHHTDCSFLLQCFPHTIWWVIQIHSSIQRFRIILLPRSALHFPAENSLIVYLCASMNRACTVTDEQQLHPWLHVHICVLVHGSLCVYIFPLCSDLFYLG